jgi:hypothetical protein
MRVSYLDRLSTEQRRALEHGVGKANGQARRPLLVIAGAGSGKTSTLAHRVAHLIVRGADPRRILLFVTGCPACRPGDALDMDVPHQRAVRIAVQDAEDLVHPGPSAGIVRLQAGTGKYLVHVTGYRAGFVQAEAGMFEGGNSPEWCRT